MMKITAINFFRLLLITSCVSWYQCNADQQSSKDDAVNFAKSLTGGVVDGAKNTPAASVPGFTTTSLPETGYYGSQDLGGMQTDAQTLLSTGAGNSAAQFAYDQSTVPKLLFSETDPLITNAGSVGANAVINPDVLTVTTGGCAVTDVSSAETNIEHCTAWMIPTVHTCSRTLDVSVTWSNQTNCTVGSGFNQVTALGWDFSSYGQSLPSTDWVHARAYCNPGLPADVVEIEVMAEGAYGSCTGWRRFTVSTNQPTYVQALPGTFIVDTGLAELWFAGGAVSCSDPLLYLNDSAWVYPYVKGECINGNCDYTIVFYSDWNGLSLGTHPLHLTFAKPDQTIPIPSVSEVWNDTCGYLEAQVLP